MSERIHLSLDKTAQATLQNLESVIDNRYGGNKSKFFRDMLMNYDNQSRLKAKRDMIEQRIERLENEIEDLQLQKKAVQQEIEENTVEEDETSNETITEVGKEFWDNTVKLVFVRRSSEDPADIGDRYEKWFDGRHQLHNNRSGQKLSLKAFRSKLFEEAEERGHKEKVKELKQKLGVTGK